jgi:hypothetical protein
MTYKQCESCRIRYNVPPLAGRDSYNPLPLDSRTFSWFENAAKVFDEEGGAERFTAAEFIAWLRPDIVIGKRRAA